MESNANDAICQQWQRQQTGGVVSREKLSGVCGGLTMAKEYIEREAALSAIKQAFEKGDCNNYLKR